MIVLSNLQQLLIPIIMGHPHTSSSLLSFFHHHFFGLRESGKLVFPQLPVIKHLRMTHSPLAPRVHPAFVFIFMASLPLLNGSSPSLAKLRCREVKRGEAEWMRGHAEQLCTT